MCKKTQRRLLTFFVMSYRVDNVASRSKVLSVSPTKVVFTARSRHVKYWKCKKTSSICLFMYFFKKVFEIRGRFMVTPACFISESSLMLFLLKLFLKTYHDTKIHILFIFFPSQHTLLYPLRNFIEGLFSVGSSFVCCGKTSLSLWMNQAETPS